MLLVYAYVNRTHIDIKIPSGGVKPDYIESLNDEHLTPFNIQTHKHTQCTMHERHTNFQWDKFQMRLYISFRKNSWTLSFNSHEKQYGLPRAYRQGFEVQMSYIQLNTDNLIKSTCRNCFSFRKLHSLIEYKQIKPFTLID